MLDTASLLAAANILYRPANAKWMGLLTGALKDPNGPSANVLRHLFEQNGFVNIDEQDFNNIADIIGNSTGYSFYNEKPDLLKKFEKPTKNKITDAAATGVRYISKAVGGAVADKHNMFARALASLDDTKGRYRTGFATDGANNSARRAMKAERLGEAIGNAVRDIAHDFTNDDLDAKRFATLAEMNASGDAWNTIGRVISARGKGRS